MRLAMRLPARKSESGAADGSDPRERESAEIIDLASRTAYPAVTQRNSRSDAFGLAAGVAMVAGLGAIAFWGMNSARLTPPEGVGSPSVQPPAVVPDEAITEVPLQPVGEPGEEPVAAPAPQLANVPIQEPVVAANPYASPTLTFDASTAPQVLTNGVPAAPVTDAAPGSGTGGPAADFASRIGGVGGAPASARPMVNPTTTVTQGTLIPAILETAIDTDVPGYVRAVVSQDVRSFDGTRVLVPRSSRLIGQYQSGLQGGQKRAYVIWTRLIRPDGASVNLASPAIGFDGTTGLAGEVNNHFFRRFGSAMLLSVIGSIGTIASGGTSVILGGAGQSAAGVAAQQDGQIGPTVRVRQGEPIRVFTARDLDFSQVN